jgi:hypothetical protein
VRGKDGAVHVALVNIDPNQPHHLEIALTGVNAAQVSGRILTAGRVQDVNDFSTLRVLRPPPSLGRRSAMASSRWMFRPRRWWCWICADEALRCHRLWRCQPWAEPGASGYQHRDPRRA